MASDQIRLIQSLNPSVTTTIVRGPTDKLFVNSSGDRIEIVFDAFLEKAIAFDMRNSIMMRFVDSKDGSTVRVPDSIRVMLTGTTEIHVPPWSPELGFALLVDRAYTVFDNETLLFRTSPDVTTIAAVCVHDSYNGLQSRVRRIMSGEE